MKRASYREACQWIALNDSAGDDDDDVQGFVTTALIADLFGVSDEKVAADVIRLRKKERALPNQERN